MDNVNLARLSQRAHGIQEKHSMSACILFITFYLLYFKNKYLFVRGLFVLHICWKYNCSNCIYYNYNINKINKQKF